MPPTGPMPSAGIVFDTLFAYQKSAALKTAIDLELFTAIDDGAHTAAAIATSPSPTTPGARVGRVLEQTVACLSRYDRQFSPPARAQE